MISFRLDAAQFTCARASRTWYCMTEYILCTGTYFPEISTEKQTHLSASPRPGSGFVWRLVRIDSGNLGLARDHLHPPPGPRCKSIHEVKVKLIASNCRSNCNSKWHDPPRRGPDLRSDDGTPVPGVTLGDMGEKTTGGAGGGIRGIRGFSGTRCSVGHGVQWDTVTEYHVVPVHRAMCEYTIIPSSPCPTEHRSHPSPRAGKQDPYVVVQVGPARFRTKTCTVGAEEEEVQTACICIVYPGVCYRGRRRRCKLTVFV